MADEVILGGGTINDSQYPGGAIHINTTTTLDDGVDRTGDIDPPVDQLTGDQIGYSHKIDISTTPGAPNKDINVAIVIDRSGSTSASSGSNVDGQPGNETYLQAEKWAAMQLFDQYYNLYKDSDQVVRVTLVSYATNATNHGTWEMTPAGRAAFLSQLNGIANTGSQANSTNYTVALQALNSAWGGQSGIDNLDDNRVVFLSDGAANAGTGGIAAAKNTLVNNFHAQISGVGVGVNSSLQWLNQVDNTGGAEKIVDLTGLADLIAQPPGAPGIELDKVDVEYTYEGVDGQTHTVVKTFLKADIPVVAGSYVLSPTPADLEPDVKGGTQVQMKFTTYVNYTPSGGGPVQSKTYVSNGVVNILQSVPCFTGATMIMTDRGEVRASELHAGSMVLTRDHGFQPIRWIGKTTVPGRMLGRKSKLAPVRIKAGALGPHSPQRDLLVSPQHRMVVASEIAQRMFGAAEVLVAARHLVGYPGIEVASDLDSVEYVHFAFDRHQLVFADGALSESLYAGPMALAMLTPEQREELLAIFPEWADPLVQLTSARPIPKGSQARTLVARHSANRKALVSVTMH